MKLKQDPWMSVAWPASHIQLWSTFGSSFVRHDVTQGVEVQKSAGPAQYWVAAGGEVKFELCVSGRKSRIPGFDVTRLK